MTLREGRKGCLACSLARVQSQEQCLSSCAAAVRQDRVFPGSNASARFQAADLFQTATYYDPLCEFRGWKNEKGSVRVCQGGMQGDVLK